MCGAHLVNLALGSSEKVLRLREPNFVLESSRFDEVLVEKQHRMLASNAAVSLLARPMCANLESTRQVPSVRHRTHAPDSTGCVRFCTQRGLQTNLPPDVIWVGHWTLVGASSEG